MPRVSRDARTRSRLETRQADNLPLAFPRKYKLPNHQNGQVYLTSHRICYVDKAEPRKHSVALDLKDVERFEFYVWLTRSTHLPCGY